MDSQTHDVVPARSNYQFKRAMEKLERIVRHGLCHGHFECTVTSDIGNGNKRRLVIKSGLIHQFVVPWDEAEQP